MVQRPVLAAPRIYQITDNGSHYLNAQVPVYAKYELTFQIDGIQATNLQFPYLSSADATPYTEKYVDQGISVDAQFLPPHETDWEKAHQTPAFLYQAFDTTIDPDNPYPLDEYSWKVRFAPNAVGEWQYRIIARDRSGTTQTAVRSFAVSASPSKGFVSVSKTDSRYFEFDNGEYFPANSVNLSIKALRDDSYVQSLGANHINLVRAWLAPLNIYGTAWSAWAMMPGH